MVQLKFCYFDVYNISKIESFFHMLKKIAKIRKKICSRGGGTGQFFSKCEKITQFFEFCKYQGGKI